MRIKQITIDRLFGSYNYDINVNTNICIITGYNGLGKTTILNILNLIMNGKMDEVCYKYLFNKIVVKFSDNSYVEIKKSQDLVDNNDRNEISKSDIPFNKLYQQTSSLYYDKDGNSFHSSDLSNYSAVRALLISDNRRTLHELNSCKEWIYNEIQEARRIFNSLLLSNKDFNVLNIPKYTISEDGYKLLYQKYLEATNKLKFVKILPDTYNVQYIPYKENLEDNLINIFQTIEWNKIINAYADTVINTKIEKLVYFANMIKSLRFIDKVFEFNDKSGFKFKMLNNGDLLELSELSSGEQNQVIMLFNLIFKTESDFVVLIDEPENSMHMAWQMSYMNIIESLVNQNGYQVIVATHSPEIIGNRWSATVDLFKQYKQSL